MIITYTLSHVCFPFSYQFVLWSLRPSSLFWIPPPVSLAVTFLSLKVWFAAPPRISDNPPFLSSSYCFDLLPVYSRQQGKLVTCSIWVHVQEKLWFHTHVQHGLTFQWSLFFLLVHLYFCYKKTSFKFGRNTFLLTKKQSANFPIHIKINNQLNQYKFPSTQPA